MDRCIHKYLLTPETNARLGHPNRCMQITERSLLPDSHTQTYIYNQCVIFTHHHYHHHQHPGLLSSDQYTKTQK